MPEKIQYYIMACIILVSIVYVAISSHLFNKKYRRQKELADYYETRFSDMFFMFGNTSAELRFVRSENDRLEWELNNAKELIAKYESEIMKGDNCNEES